MADSISDEGETLPVLEVSGVSPSLAARVSSSMATPGASGRYAQTRFHARGGMGEVWLCHDAHLRRDVALKRLLSLGPAARRRFLAEAHVTGLLEHPGIVPIHDLGEDDDGRPFYVMRFVNGRSLKQAIKDYHEAPAQSEAASPLQWLRLLEIFIDLCRAVAYAHSRGVLHRDLKPDNVMLGAFGETVVLDWGLAKVRGEADEPGGTNPSGIPFSASQTAAGSVIGSPLYMPPELAEGRVAETDERTDVFLLGATLYEILTGRPPRDATSLDRLLEQARTADIVPPMRHRRLPKALNAICVKALQRDKTARYASATELEDDVTRYLAREPVSAWPDRFTVRVWRWARGHSVALKRTALVTLIAIATMVVGSALRQAEALRQREAARQAVATFDRLTDQARFYAASSDPTSEQAPYFDADKARVAIRQALATAAQWGSAFERLPLDEERPRLRSQAYELGLLAIRMTLYSPQRDAQDDIPGMLSQVRRLVPRPSEGFYALQAAYCRVQGRTADAHAAEQQARDPATPATAFDLFLRGEVMRTDVSAAAARDDAIDLASERTDRLSAAIDLYRQAINADPTHYWAHFQLGRCYMSDDRYAEAVEALGACIALRPTAPWGYSARGMALGLLGRFGEAHRDLNTAERIDPAFRPAALNQGVVFWLEHKDAEALASFDALLQPGDANNLVEAAFYRAQIRLKHRNPAGARDDLDAVLRKRPDFTPARLLRVRTELASGMTPAAVADLDALLGPMAGDVARTRLSRRSSLLRKLTTDLPPDAAARVLSIARGDLEQALKLPPPSAKLYGSLGNLSEMQGDTAAAARAYTAALALSPDSIPILLERGWALGHEGRFTEALTDFVSASRLDATNAEAHAGEGYMLASIARYDEARQRAVRSLIAGTGDYLILHDVACIYAECARTEKTGRDDDVVMVISALRQALSIWKSRSTGPNELDLIRHEPAFAALANQDAAYQSFLSDALHDAAAK